MGKCFLPPLWLYINRMNSGLLAGVGGQLRVPAECSNPPLQGSANIPCHPRETAALTSGSSFPSFHRQLSVIAESAGASHPELPLHVFARNTQNTQSLHRSGLPGPAALGPNPGRGSCRWAF